MEIVATGLAFFAPDIETLTFPAWDCLPYDRASPNAGIVARRIATLSRLAQTGAAEKQRIILTTVNASLQKLLPPDLLRQASFRIEAGGKLERARLLTFLHESGYRRVGKAMEAGEYALRGSIIDIMLPGSGQGVRLDLFGEELESIRLFAPESQTSSGKQDMLLLTPVNEVLMTPEAIARFREGYRNAFGANAKDDPLYEAISEGRNYPGMEHWLPLFHPKLVSLLDYIPTARIVQNYQVENAQNDRFALTQDYYEARLNMPKQKGSYQAPPYHPLPPELLYLDADAWGKQCAGKSLTPLSPFASAEGGKQFALQTGWRSARGQEHGAWFEQLKNRLEKREKPVLVAAYSTGSRARLKDMLAEHGLRSVLIEEWAEAGKLSGNQIGITVFPIEQGFETENLLLLSEQDLLGDRIVRVAKKKKASEHFMAEAASFLEGELVVHKEHGVARFDGLVTLEVNGARHDCLKLVYEGEDKLFLPVENIDLITRYGSDEAGARLDKLGSASWQARKAKLKERITIAAEVLLKTAAQRALRKGEALVPPPGLYDEFCAGFPYTETEDQARAIDDTLEDIASGRPMDRLICGDVGFGKTEVALRAAFAAVAALEGKVQVALVCPTTLLARQHFHSFKTRFEGFPFQVRLLSRLVSAKSLKETREGLKSGAIDIVIGTHALLAKSIEFKNLGLLIVDEEQHFGVGQKEKLKELKANIHVLTLSATPIPRTLQMALTGVRDLSLITTPPVDRLAVRSFVMPFDAVIAREAILREHHRGGKTFVVCPRVKDIAEIKHALLTNVPEVRLAVAHGQMAASELEKVMNDFYDGKADVLLSTAIIESGIDIPTANTMIIHRADMFGLSQLYQLRGRVGRSKARAYAYFTLPHQKKLSKAAIKRLEVMQTLDSLGAGFSVASHDMDIRGFGNLVGEEQSGHVREVGIELYQQMLEDAVEQLRAVQGKEAAQMTKDRFSPQINIGMAVLIPEEYVSDLSLRMGLYKRAAGLANEAEIESFAAELVDRFGPLPVEVAHLLSVMRIKQLCLQAGVERLDAGPKGIVLSFHKNEFAQPEALLSYIAKQGNAAKLRPDHKLVLIKELEDETQKLRDVTRSIEAIARLAA